MGLTRLNFVLLLTLIALALAVVTSRHQWRKAFIQLQTENERESKLDQEWRELQIESQTLSTHKRIEQKATRELGMVVPDPKKVVVVQVAGAAAAPAGAPPAAATVEKAK